MLVRCVGPGLTAFGVAGAGATGTHVAARRGRRGGDEPRLGHGQRGGHGGVGRHDGGRRGVCAGVGQRRLRGVATLEPGAYTAPVTAIDGGISVAPSWRRV